MENKSYQSAYSSDMKLQLKIIMNFNWKHFPGLKNTVRENFINYIFKLIFIILNLKQSIFQFTNDFLFLFVSGKHKLT